VCWRAHELLCKCNEYSEVQRHQTVSVTLQCTTMLLVNDAHALLRCMTLQANMKAQMLACTTEKLPLQCSHH
jgi:hypothetical protein